MISGHNVMKSYWDKPDATAETVVDGWLYTVVLRNGSSASAPELKREIKPPGQA